MRDNPKTPALSVTDAGEAVQFGTPEMAHLIEALGRSAAESRAEGCNPHAAIDLVCQSRLGSLRIPHADGGGGCSVREFFSILITPTARRYWRLRQR